jgi:hypothetical protein
VKNSSQQLTKEKSKIAKKNFDLICNYSKRKEIGLENIGHLYDENLCNYLIQKCFKKSASDSYESFFRFEAGKLFELEEGNCQKLNLVSLGGGPASDMSGMICYLFDQNFGVENFECVVLDKNFENWRNASQTVLVGGFSKEKKIKQFSLDFEFLDFTDFDSLEKNEEVLKNAHFLTICWAINEAQILENFWSKFFLLTENACVIIIEGKENKLQELEEICKSTSPTSPIITEYYESPRRLIKLPARSPKNL